MTLIPRPSGSSVSRPQRQTPVPDLELFLSPDYDQSPMLRAKIREWCSTEGFSDLYSDDVVLVASELFSNAVRATVGAASITAGVEHHRGGALVRMMNEGPGFDPDALPAPNPQRGGGRGIWMAKALGTVAVAQRHTKTIVTVVVG